MTIRKSELRFWESSANQRIRKKIPRINLATKEDSRTVNSRPKKLTQHDVRTLTDNIGINRYLRKLGTWRITF